MTSQFVDVYDGLVPKNIQNNIENFLVQSNQVNWIYQPNLSGIEKGKLEGYAFPFWSSGISERRDNQVVFFLNQPLYLLLFHLGLQLFECYESRSFLQNPIGKNIAGLDGIHVDLDVEHWVCLYYVNDSDGDTIFFDDDENEIKRVSPKKGRIAFFDGSIKHCTSTPSKNKRVVLNFNFIGGYE